MEAIRFEIWDYATIDGGGYAVIRRPESCEHRPMPVSDVFTTTARVTAHSVDTVETGYRARWSVELDVRYCACGCLRGTTEIDRPLFTDGQSVTYHGSLTGLHGLAYYCGPCRCSNDDCAGAELETSDGQVITHVRYGSYSPLDD